MAQLTKPICTQCRFYPQSPTIIQNCPLFSTDFHYKDRIKRMQAENAAKLLILRVASSIVAFTIIRDAVGGRTRTENSHQRSSEKGPDAEQKGSAGGKQGEKKVSQPISRVLSRTIIHLRLASPQAFSGLPEPNASSIDGFLFGLAPSGVYTATNCYQSRGALLPHLFTLTEPCDSRKCLTAAARTSREIWRYIFCCTSRRLTPPRRYLAPCSVEPGLSSDPVLERR